jgi:hypothetical protein
MNRLTRSLLAAAGTVAVALLGLPAVAQASTTAATVTVIASGLNGPRHLIGAYGGIAVAEAGTGGTLQCPTATQCLGRTGAITVAANGTVRRVITNLPSLANKTDGGYAVGPADISVGNGELAVAMSTLASGTDPVTGANPFGANAPEMDRLLHYPPSLPPTARIGADFGAYEVHNNPDNGAGAPAGEEKESNPYGLTAYRGGYAVVDAAANSLLWVGPDEAIQTLAVLPTKTIAGRVVQSVPTAVEVGPDGALYVSELSNSPGSARVYRVVPGQAPTVYADGFTLLTDLAFDAQGRLLVTSISTAGTLFPPGPGEVVRVEANGTRTHYTTGIVSPTGIAAFGSDIYVSNQGLVAGQGQVLRLRLP